MQNRTSNASIDLRRLLQPPRRLGQRLDVHPSGHTELVPSYLDHAAFEQAYSALDLIKHSTHEPLWSAFASQDLGQTLSVVVSEFAKAGSTSFLERRLASLEGELMQVRGRLAAIESAAAAAAELDERFNAELDHLLSRQDITKADEPDDFDFSGAFDALG